MRNSPQAGFKHRRLGLALCIVWSAAAVAYGVTTRFRPRPAPAVTPIRPVAPLFPPSLADSVLEDPQRDRWQQPERLVQALGIQPGDTVADVGSGSGYLLPYLSRAVGPDGVVYAEEVQSAFLPQLRQRAKVLGNVRVILGTPNDPKLPPGRVDHFVLLTVYHEVELPVEFLRTLHRFAAPGARLAIIDFDAARKGDPPAPAGHQVSEKDVLIEASAAGWRLSERHDFLGSQFFLIFERSPG